jgi:predicted DsbA family dithiol-disulfide isomerase
MSAVAATVDVYFDYLCPYAYRAAEVVAHVACAERIDFEWHHFSTFQAASTSAACHVWNDRLELGDERGCRGLLPFLASLAARRQGRDAFDRFRLGLLRARHRDGLALDWATMLHTADTAGLHLPTFRRDVEDPEARTILAREHCDGARRDVRATPTLVFADGGAVCLRLRGVPRDEREALGLFHGLHDLLVQHPYLESLSRPRGSGN